MTAQSSDVPPGRRESAKAIKKAARKIGRLMVPTGLQTNPGTAILQTTCGDYPETSIPFAPKDAPVPDESSLKSEALDALQYAWQSLRRIENLSDDPKEVKAAGLAREVLDKAFRILEAE